MKWKRANYLVHRWSGITLGALLAMWFGSGIVMMYYPYPVMTESERESLLLPFAAEAAGRTIGFAAAVDAARGDFAARGHPVARDPGETIVGGRLRAWNGRLVYQIHHQRGYRVKPYLLVDAHTGEVLSPISSDAAAEVATALSPDAARGLGSDPDAAAARVEALPRGDHYMFWGSYHLEDFPVYRVELDDADRTFVYVGAETGRIYASADRLARVATWTGTVPHWLYFMWLYERRDLWTWLNLLLPGAAVVISLTGMVLGAYQLFPRRSRGEWRVSAYHGMSIWHHVSGVIFGLLVFTWTLSGVFEMMGGGNDPRAGHAEAVRGGPLALDRIALTEADALAAAAMPSDQVVAIDLTQLDGRPGYRIQTADGSERSVDAVSGLAGEEITAGEAARAASRIMDGLESAGPIERIDAYDSYYYARHGREKTLPAWRIPFDDPASSVVYLDVVTGLPVGFVDDDTRLWRWLRDAMHSLDFPVLTRNRPLWDLVVLPLMVGGTLSALTGIWLSLRRLARKKRRHDLLRRDVSAG